MIISESTISGVFQIQATPFRDCRGAFQDFWEQDLFIQNEINFKPNSSHFSYNQRQNTVRAFHYQVTPYEQTKLITCVSGRIWDVVVDIRQFSPTFSKWTALELSAVSGRSHLVPAGCAHGFLTLEDNSIVAYLIEGEYKPESARVIRWNDPNIAVSWPTKDPILSTKDAFAPFLYQ